MNSDIRLEVGFFAHRKTISLRSGLGDSGLVALLRLWCWAACFRPDGDLADLEDREIESAAGWSGGAGALLLGLREAGFLDGETRRYELRNWRRHQAYVTSAEQRIAKARNAGKASGKARRSVRTTSSNSEFEPPPDPPSPPVTAKPTAMSASPTNQPERQAILEAWNRCAIVGLLSRVERLTDDRKRKLATRLLHHPERDLDWWQQYFERINATPFLRGENNNGWRADFDFAIRSEAVVSKILEGGYDRSARAGPTKQKPAPSESTLNLIRKITSNERDSSSGVASEAQGRLPESGRRD